MSLQSKLKSKFLRSIEDGGAREVKRLVITGKVRKDEPIDLEKELVEAKAKIGSASIGLFEITDDNLREVLRKVCKRCKLEVRT